MTAAIPSALFDPAPFDPVAAEARLRRAVDELVAADADFAGVVAELGPPPVEIRPHGFPTLMRAIVAQQVSAASARAIWGRLEAACMPLAPDVFAALDDDAVRALGFSRQKLAYGRGLAQAILDGSLDLDAVAAMEDEAAIETLSALKGIGRWTAEVYLLFALGRTDVLPAHDLALQIAAQRLKNLPDRPTPARFRDLAEAWRPWRGAASILLWHHYRAMP